MFRQLKSQRGAVPLVEILVLALVLAAGAAVYVRVQNENKSAKVEDAGGVKKKAKPVVKVDPTAKWTAYSSQTGQFSLKYNPDWLKLNCDSLTEVLYLAPTQAALAICNSEKGSQISVSSMAGDIRQQYQFGNDYGSKSTENLTVSGVAGQKLSATLINNPEGPTTLVVGTKEVRYLFYTNNRTYAATYQQSPSGDYSQDVLADFELMVESTLKFSP